MAHYGVAPVMFEGVSQVTATNSVELGTRITFAGEDYVYAYNNTGSQATLGALMIQTGATGWSMTRSTTAALDFPACAVKHAAVPAGSYFWGLVRGSTLLMSIAMTAGQVITVGADGNAQTYFVGSFPTGPAIGKCLVVSTAATQPLCYVRLNG